MPAGTMSCRSVAGNSACVTIASIAVAPAAASAFAQAIMVAVAVAALEQMFFFVPGSLGTLEMSRFKTLSFLGVDDAHSVAFALTMRLHNLFWNGLGLLAYALCTHRAVLPQATQPVASPPAAAPPPGC